MEKKYKTFKQRLDILRNRRMNIPKNTGKQRNIIKKYNYYNLVNAYKDPFLEFKGYNPQNEDIYETDTKPEHLEALLLFDVALRTLFFPYLLKIEEELKTVLVESFYQTHHHSDLHKESEYLKRKYYDLGKTSTWSAHEKSGSKYIKLSEIRETDNMYKTPYKKLFDNEKTYDDFIVNVYSAIAKQRQKNKSISKYLSTHTYIPMWVLVNLLTFGNISKLFQIQKLDVQTKVLNYFNIDSFKEHNPKLDVVNFSNILNILSVYRNICAHNERLYCYEIKMNIDDSFMKYLSFFPEEASVNALKGTAHKLSQTERKNLNRRRKGVPTLLFALKLFLSPADFRKIKFSLNEELNKLKKKLPINAYDKLVKIMGLNFDWQTSFK